MKSHPASIRLAVLLLVSILIPVSTAEAQNALGSGDALDANLNRLTGRRNAPSSRLDYRTQNLLITGDVAGGRGFRDSVGYRASDDFRGDLGADDLFRFRSESALSSLGLVQYGSVLQDFQRGQGSAALEYRRTPRVGMSGSFVSSGLVYGDLTDVMTRLDQVAQDRLNSERRTLLAEPNRLGMTTSENGQSLMLSASSLQGLALTPIDDQTAPTLDPYDQARLQDDAQRGRSLSRVSLPTMLELQDSRVADTRLDSSMGEDQRRSSVNEEYINILQRIADRYASNPDVRMDVQADLFVGLEEQLQDLREQLARHRRPDEADSRKPVERLNPEDETPDEDERTGAPADEDAGQTSPPVSAPTPSGIERFGVILKHGEKLDHYAADREDRFNELMRSAEDRLKNSEYFWAEQRFNRALRIMPDHPLALAGVIHAQIGAGLYLPSALTLRHLLTSHPELIDVLYAPNMLPDQARLLNAVGEIQQRLEQKLKVAPHGFVLAYLGHQLDNPALIKQGLDSMATDPDDETFVTLLRDIWLAP